jgi:hypothetical protein
VWPSHLTEMYKLRATVAWIHALLSREESVFDAVAWAGMDIVAMLRVEWSGWTCGRGRRDAHMGGNGLVLAFWWQYRPLR